MEGFPGEKQVGKAQSMSVGSVTPVGKCVIPFHMRRKDHRTPRATVYECTVTSALGDSHTILRAARNYRGDIASIMAATWVSVMLSDTPELHYG